MSQVGHALMNSWRPDSLFFSLPQILTHTQLFLPTSNPLTWKHSLPVYSRTYPLFLFSIPAGARKESLDLSALTIRNLFLTFSQIFISISINCGCHLFTPRDCLTTTYHMYIKAFSKALKHLKWRVIIIFRPGIFFTLKSLSLPGRKASDFSPAHVCGRRLLTELSLLQAGFPLSFFSELRVWEVQSRHINPLFHPCVSRHITLHKTTVLFGEHNG